MGTVIKSPSFTSKDNRRPQYYACAYFCVYAPVVCGKQSSDAYVHNIHNVSSNCGNSHMILQAMSENIYCLQYCA